MLEYNGGIPERHQNDISLSFRGYFTWSDIIIPDGRQWLDAVVRPGCDVSRFDACECFHARPTVCNQQPTSANVYPE